MALKVNTTTIKDLNIYNENDGTTTPIYTLKTQKDGSSSIIWERPLTLDLVFEDRGESFDPKYIKTFKVNRYETLEPTSFTGDLADGNTVYYGDKFFMDIKAIDPFSEYTYQTLSRIINDEHIYSGPELSSVPNLTCTFNSNLATLGGTLTNTSDYYVSYLYVSQHVTYTGSLLPGASADVSYWSDDSRLIFSSYYRTNITTYTPWSICSAPDYEGEPSVRALGNKQFEIIQGKGDTFTIKYSADKGVWEDTNREDSISNYSITYSYTIAKPVLSYTRIEGSDGTYFTLTIGNDNWVEVQYSYTGLWLSPGTISARTSANVNFGPTYDALTVNVRFRYRKSTSDAWTYSEFNTIELIPFARPLEKPSNCRFEWKYDDTQDSYYDVYMTNPNNIPCTLHYRFSDGFYWDSWRTAPIDAGATYSAGFTTRNTANGEAYLTADGYPDSSTTSF